LTAVFEKTVFAGMHSSMRAQLAGNIGGDLVTASGTGVDEPSGPTRPVHLLQVTAQAQARQSGDRTTDCCRHVDELHVDVTELRYRRERTHMAAPPRDTHGGSTVLAMDAGMSPHVRAVEP
jgi:hypothetical protein